MSKHLTSNYISIGQFSLLLMVYTSIQLGSALFVLPQTTRCRLDYYNLPTSVVLDPGCSHVTCGSSCGAPCPDSRDCQGKGVIVCKVMGLSVPFVCGYSDESCFLFHKVTSCTNGGSVATDGTCVCPPGFIGEFCHQYVHTCHDIYLRNPDSASGEYSLITNNDAAMTVWCSFRNDVILTYFSKSAITNLTTDELSLHYNIDTEVDVVAKWNDGSQTESTLEQVTSFSSFPLGVMVNEYSSYSSPANVHLAPYLYLGIVPSSEISVGVTHGYRANEVDKTFRNCDSNPNSYFVFYVNPDNQSPVKTSGDLPNNGIMSHWNKNPRILSSGDTLPDDYFLETEMHFGGCGGYLISSSWTDGKGLNLGLRHSKLA